MFFQSHAKLLEQSMRKHLNLRYQNSSQSVHFLMYAYIGLLGKWIQNEIMYFS